VGGCITLYALRNSGCHGFKLCYTHINVLCVNTVLNLYQIFMEYNGTVISRWSNTSIV